MSYEECVCIIGWRDEEEVQTGPGFSGWEAVPGVDRGRASVPPPLQSPREVLSAPACSQAVER